MSYKNVPDEMQGIVHQQARNAIPQDYRYPTTKDEYWQTVDKYWPQLLDILLRFLPNVNSDLNSPNFGRKTAVIAEELRSNRNDEIVYLFDSAWASAPDDGRIHVIPCWNILCDLCSESYLLFEE